MIPALVSKERRHQTVIRKYNTLIHSVTRPKEINRVFEPRKYTQNMKKMYQNTSQNLKWLGFFAAMLGLLNTILIFYEAEQYFKGNFHVNRSINSIRAIILVICLVHSINVLFIHILIDQNSSFSYWESFIDLLKTSSRLKHYLLDLIICIIHSPPGVSLTFTFTQLGIKSELSCSDLIFTLSLLKLKYLLLFIAQQSAESSKRSQLILFFFPINNNLLFILKCVIHKWTYSSFLITFWMSLFGFGALFRVFEKDLGGDSVWDYIWLAFTTESTVGYGEVYPKTHIGRFIAGIASVLGVFMFSYSVMAVRDLFTLSKEEVKLSGMLNFNKKVHKKLSPKAVELIIKAWKVFQSKKLSDLFSLIEASKAFKKLRMSLMSDLSASIDQQLNDSGKLMSRKLQSGIKIFKNVDFQLARTKKVLSLTLNNYKRLKVISKIFSFSSSSSSFTQDSANLKIPGPKSILKSRKNAVKQLFVRRVANSPRSSRNSLLCYSSID